MKTILLDPTEAFFPDMKLSLKKIGRKSIINSELYLNAVRKIHSMNDQDVADELVCSKKTVYRFRIDERNNDVIVEAEKHIEEMSKIGYTRDLDNWGIFYNIPILQKWEDILIKRRVSENKRRAYMRSFWHVCKYLRVHPKKISVEDCADLNIEMRELYYGGKNQPYGLAYLCIRESIRSFFMLIHKMSGEYLTNIGVGKESGLGDGRYSKQKVPRIVRHRFEEILQDCVDSYGEYLELLELARFMYYTGTRITASLEFNFNEYLYELNKDMWIFEVIDKGVNGGIKWEKYLVGHALDSFKEYCSKRFKIPIDELEEKLPYKTDNLFPSFIINGETRDDLVRDAFKLSLIKSGLNYKKFPPTHIWRHTFAQDFLASSNWNYELCASLGGWISTSILKKHYGKMGLHPKIVGLKRSMGMPVEEETYELKW